MEIFKDLLNFNILDAIDIFLVALLLYYVYKLIRGTVAINIFIGIVIFYLFFLLVDALQMRMLSTILGGFMSVGIIALIVVFQPEIRKFLLMIGSTNFGKKSGILSQFKFLSNTVSGNATNADTIVDACVKMGSTKTGALLVLERNNNLDFLVETGDEMNINIERNLDKFLSENHDVLIITTGHADYIQNDGFLSFLDKQLIKPLVIDTVGLFARSTYFKSYPEGKYFVLGNG